VSETSSLSDTQYASADFHRHIIPVTADQFQWGLHFAAILLPRRLAFLALRRGWEKVINFEPNGREATVFTKPYTTAK
jgi:hypothetical protein